MQSWQNSYDGNLTKVCGTNAAFNRVRSQHSNLHEDRQWIWDCQNITQIPFTDCYWNGYIDEWDNPIHVQCEPDYVLNGVESFHHNYYEDRQWKIRCCKAPNYFARSCEVSDYVNQYNEYMNYSVDYPRVFTGMFSAYEDISRLVIIIVFLIIIVRSRNSIPGDKFSVFIRPFYASNKLKMGVFLGILSSIGET